MVATRPVTVVVVAVLLLGATGSVGTVVAQENNTTTTTPGNESDPWTDPEGAETTDTNPGEDAENQSGPGASNSGDSAGDSESKTLSRYTEITDWEYSGGQWVITFDASEPVTVTLSQAGQAEEGATTFNIRQVTLDRGVNTVTFEAAALNGEAQVSIVSEYSIDEGRGVLLSTGQTGGSSPFEGTSATAGWLGGATITTLMGVLAFRRRLKGGRGAPEEV
ncbi:hypothetical protein [Halostella salina]|uniref:hypothetical protein n=1 Tax=Halostella salina TaxID=1547897 RepID=UPI000EF8127B|nr:hypothetical protein [Halostella salina]